MSKLRRTSDRSTRRQFLRRFALASAGGAVLGAGAVTAALLSRRPRVVLLPHGADVPGVEPVVASPDIVSRADWGALPVNFDARNENGYYE